MRARVNRNLDGYQFTVRPLSKDEGGGYLVEYPDIPGCMSDGETIEEAIANGREALRVLDDVPEADGERVWATHVAGIADPKLTATERVVAISEFMDAAVHSKPTAAGLLCPGCRSPLHWQFTGIS